MYYYQLDALRLRETFAPALQGMNNSMREAEIFLKCIELYPIYIQKDDLFAGWYGFESKEALEGIYSCAKTLSEPEVETSEQVKWLFKQGYLPAGHDIAHHISDYKAILARGINAYIEDVKAELKNPDNNEDKNNYLLSMLKALGGAELLSSRFAMLAEKCADEVENAEDKKRLRTIAEICKKVPMQPPTDFLEAVQAVCFVRMLNCMSTFTCISVSLGNFDQYMYPYYLKSKEKGMTDEEVTSIILQLFRMLDNYGGKDCALSVGGVDENGNDITNELSYLLVRAEKQSKLCSPLFVARINKNTPAEFMRELVSKELFEMGQPSFYSEENCYEAIVKRGVEKERAKQYQISSCMNIAMADSDVVNAWGCRANTHLALELALNGGKAFGDNIGVPLKTKPKSDYKNIDEVFEQYKAYMTELFDYAMDWSAEHTRIFANEFPAPWLSALAKTCVQRGKDRWGGGAEFQIMVIEMMGFANTADSFTAIETLVFDEKKYTVAELVEAAKANYENYEAIHWDLLKCDKYGMNKERADKNARKLLDLNADICQNKQKENVYYAPSLHTLWNDVYWGKGIGAFLDGRRAGEPVNKNAGPSTSVRNAGPTNVVLSATKIDQSRYSGGQALDVHIGVRNLETVTNRDKIAAFIRTYFSLGGLQIQVNGLSTETLQKAYNSPEKYPNLMVRIGGHSRYFNEFGNEMKLKFIERFKVEEGAFGS